MHGTRAAVLAVVGLASIASGGFWFFRVVPSVCTPARDPSGGMSPLCTLGMPSPYQHIVMAWHARVLHEMCAIDAETGDVECRPPLPASGCDQSATTTPCSVLDDLARQNSPPPQETAMTNATIGNFSFEYPSKAIFGPSGREKVVIPGTYQIAGLGPDGQSAVFISVASAPPWFSSLNPHATSLNDYRADYPLSATTTRQVLVKDGPTTIETREIVRILSNEDIIVNGIPMLRQRYSVGHWQPDFDGTIVFWDTDEAEVRDELRYVFFEGETFVVITGWHADAYIERIVQSVRLAVPF